MNQKQAKLLRYFEKASGDKELTDKLRASWSTLTDAHKGKLTTWLKKVVVTMLAIQKARANKIKEYKKQKLQDNLAILKDFQ